MSFLGYTSAEDMLKRSGKTPEECLKLIDDELDRIRNEKKEIEQRIPKEKTRYDTWSHDELYAECKRRGIL